MKLFNLLDALGNKYLDFIESVPLLELATRTDYVIVDKMHRENTEQPNVFQVATIAAGFIFSTYLTVLLFVLIIVGLAAAFYFPDWTPLEILK